MSCRNLGDEFMQPEDPKNKCPKDKKCEKKNYPNTCMYNTQGKYMCSDDKTRSESGIYYILNKKK